MVLEKLDSYMQKHQTGVLSHTIKKKIQNGLKTNIRPEIIKVLVDNIGNNLFDINLSNFFGYMSTEK